MIKIPANKVVVTFTDGRVEEAPLRPSALIAAERHYGNAIPPLEGTLFMAWHVFGRPENDFDKWTESVEDYEEVARERPTGATTGQPLEPSPTSPSEPGSTPEP